MLAAVPFALASNDLASLVALVLAAGGDVHAGDDAALRWASQRGQRETVERLLAAGADVRARGHEALKAASREGYADVVELLLAAPGAGVHADVALQHACEHGHLRVVELLIAASANVRADKSEALRRASEYGHVAVIACLLAAGADLHAEKDRALGLAVGSGHLAAVECLLAAGADVHTRDDVALRIASKHGSAAMVERLLAAGASVHAERDEAIQLASGSGNAPVVERLLAAGADPAKVDWAGLAKKDSNAWASVMQLVPTTAFPVLPEAVRACWLRHNLRPRRRLAAWLQRARDRLNHPPTTALPAEPGPPTRDQLVAHLKSAGRRYARVYWAQRLPIDFPGVDFGPLPTEFIWGAKP